MQIVSIGDNLHEMSNLTSGKSNKNISVFCLLKILPNMLNIKASRKILEIRELTILIFFFFSFYLFMKQSWVRVAVHKFDS